MPFMGMRAGWNSKMVKNFKAAEAENNMHLRSLFGSSGVWFFGVFCGDGHQRANVGARSAPKAKATNGLGRLYGFSYSAKIRIGGFIVLTTIAASNKTYFGTFYKPLSP